MVTLIVILSFVRAVAAQSCQIHSETFETEFCKMKSEVDVLKQDSPKVAYNEIEISKLWHTIQAETNNVYENRKAIENLKHNMTAGTSIVPSGSGIVDTIHNLTTSMDEKMKNLTEIVMTLEKKMRQLELKCSTCGGDGHPCHLKPCQNGGKCVEIGKDFYCACPIGLAGKVCEIKDHCVASPCQNNGTCVNNVIAHTCICPYPYTGPNCTIEIQPCDTNPCARGMCVPQGKSYKCLCKPGFYGDLCNSIVDPALITTLPPKSTVSISTTTSSSTVSTEIPTTKSKESTQSAKTANLSTTVTGIIIGAGATSTTINKTLITTTTFADPCAKPGLCNEPSKCVPNGQTYSCVCPQTNKTTGNPCLEPYFLEQFAICCMKDTCQPGADPIC